MSEKLNIIYIQATQNAPTIFWTSPLQLQKHAALATSFANVWVLLEDPPSGPQGVLPKIYDL